MPIRFRRTLKVAPGVKLNFSKSGVSTTVGPKGFHFTFGKRGVRRTVSIPGTGISEVDYIKKNILPGIGNPLHMKDKDSVQYYVDWKNSRIIVLDQYADILSNVTSPETLKWLENTITSATQADHVFIAFHEPRIPRPGVDDPFWNLLLKHHDKVRAVFVAHTHVYERRKIGKGEAGIDLINVGNAGKSGHSDNQQTIVEVMVYDSVVFYRTVQALDGTAEFRLTEEWESSAPKKDQPVAQPAPDTTHAAGSNG